MPGRPAPHDNAGPVDWPGEPIASGTRASAYPAAPVGPLKTSPSQAERRGKPAGERILLDLEPDVPALQRQRVRVARRSDVAGPPGEQPNAPLPNKATETGFRQAQAERRQIGRAKARALHGDQWPLGRPADGRDGMDLRLPVWSTRSAGGMVLASILMGRFERLDRWA